MNLVNVGLIILIIGLTLVVIGIFAYNAFSMEKDSVSNMDDEEDELDDDDSAPAMTIHQSSVFASTNSSNNSNSSFNNNLNVESVESDSQELDNNDIDIHNPKVVAQLQNGLNIENNISNDGVFTLPISSCRTKPLDLNPEDIKTDVEDFNPSDVMGDSSDIVREDNDIVKSSVTGVLSEDDTLSRIMNNNDTDINEYGDNYPVSNNEDFGLNIPIDNDDTNESIEINIDVTVDKNDVEDLEGNDFINVIK